MPNCQSGKGSWIGSEYDIVLSSQQEPPQAFKLELNRRGLCSRSVSFSTAHAPLSITRARAMSCAERVLSPSLLDQEQNSGSDSPAYARSSDSSIPAAIRAQAHSSLVAQSPRRPCESYCNGPFPSPSSSPTPSLSSTPSPSPFPYALICMREARARACNAVHAVSRFPIPPLSPSQ